MAGDPQIRVLPDNVANKIAAGEVVERPASVLKELLENALDAGSTRVDVEVTAGGRKLVAVSDNGSGMSCDNALLCVERHATSKIRDVDDIEQIDTLGFRGEALAAIASVSRFRLITAREGDTAGSEIVIAGGKMADVRDAGAPAGTRIEVRDLFFNVPARRKFLRSYQTELFHLRAAFILQALAHPGAAMSLKVDGRETYALGASADLGQRVREIFGTDYAERLRPVEYTGDTADVSGLAGVPSFNRSDRSEQYVFVNGRPTSAPLIGYSIREGYHGLLPGGRHPCVFLFIKTDPGLVDVNVHPTKKEVRFRRPGDVRDAVIAAIREALGASPRDDEPSAPRPADVAGRGPETQLQIVDLPRARAFQYPRKPLESFAAQGGDTTPGPFEGPTAPPPFPETAADERPASSIPNLSSEALAEEDLSPPSPWSWCRVLGQIGGLYVVLETEDGYVLMDPHAGHERVLFEKLLGDVERNAVPSQSLLLPQTVELPPRDAQRVRKNLEMFRKMGFGISEFGGDTFVVDALPSYLSGAAAATVLGEVASEFEKSGARAKETRWLEESIARAACRSAVKARDRLTLEEIEHLVVELAQTDMPYTCPHGRPTLIFTSFKELDKRFARE